MVEWLEHLLHPWTSFVILPLFALANAGIPLSSEALSDAASSPITLGVVWLVGKLVGVTAFTWLAARLGLGVLPAGATWRTSSAWPRWPASGSPCRSSSPAWRSRTWRQNEAKVGILVAGPGGRAGIVDPGPPRSPLPTRGPIPAAVHAVRRSAL